jgi:hypothetical protein
MTDCAPDDVVERLKLRAEIAQLREANMRLREQSDALDNRLKLAQTATISAETADKLAAWINEQHKAAAIDIVERAVANTIEHCAQVALAYGKEVGCKHDAEEIAAAIRASRTKGKP